MIEFGARLTLQDQMSATLLRNIQRQREFTQAIDSTREALEQVTGGNYNADVEVDTSAAQQQVDQIQEVLDQVNGTDTTATVEADTSEAQRETEQLRENLDGLRDPVNARVNVNDSGAQQRVSALRERLASLRNTVTAPVVRLRDEASRRLQSIRSTLSSVGSRVAAPFVRLRDQATDRLNRIRNSLNNIRSQVAAPFVRLRDSASAALTRVRNNLRTVGRTIASPVIRVRDTASRVVSGVSTKIRSVGRMVASPFIRIKDTASGIISNIGNKLSNLGNKIAAPLVKVRDAASSVLSKIGGVLKTLAKGVTIAVGIAGAGATAFMGGALSQGADLEQSIGGVETLFKDSAGIVKANADAAFQTAGLSANNYMETVTAFSASLLSSLSGDTQKAAQVADMAVVDMSDNANKMGTNMEDIQNAYQGFAKQNYTMLDNLKLGYGGTKTEMERLLTDAQKLTGEKYDINNLSDVYNAIHAIQENLDITGTTAKEAATTFSGSFNSMKAAAQNLLGNMAIGGDVKTSMSQLVESAVTFAFDNAIPMIGNVFSAIPSAIQTAIETGAPKVKQAGASIVKSLSSGLMDLLPDSMKTVTTSVSNVASTVKQAGAGVGDVASEVSKYVEYTVQSGDTLSAIAKQYKTTYQELAEYNNIPDPNKIFTGQTIQVPNTQAADTSQSEAASSQPETTTTTSLNMDNPIISSFANLAAASLGMVQTAFSSLKTAVSAAAGTVISVLPGITNATAAVAVKQAREK